MEQVHTRTHTVPAGTMGQALIAAGAPSAVHALAFDFDLIERLANVSHLELRARVMPRLAFACDAYINIAINRALSKLRVDNEEAGTHSWDTYQAFLHYAAGIAASEELMTEAGMLVTPLRDTVQKLFNCRTQIHGVLRDSVGSSYEVPVITDWMRNPRVRRDDASTLQKLQAAAKHGATDLETGVIDVELEKQLQESIAMKRAVTKADQLKWDKQRGELAATMFDALRIRDDIVDIGFAGDHEEPFLDLDPLTQYKLLTGTKRYISDALLDLVDDRKITAEDHAAAMIESRPLLKAIRIACEHKRFENVDA